MPFLCKIKNLPHLSPPLPVRVTRGPRTSVSTQGSSGRDEGGGAGAQQGRMAGVDHQWGTLEGLRACCSAGSVGTVV